MKQNLIVINFLTLFFLFSGFVNDDKSKAIARKWKIDASTTKSNFEKSFVSTGDKQADETAKKNIEVLLTTLGNTVSEYKSNGELVNTYSGKNAEGKAENIEKKSSWKLSPDSKQLIVNENGQETVLDIVTLNEKKMELAYKATANQKNPFVIVYLPVK